MIMPQAAVTLLPQPHPVILYVVVSHRCDIIIIIYMYVLYTTSVVAANIIIIMRGTAAACRTRNIRICRIVKRVIFLRRVRCI